MLKKLIPFDKVPQLAKTDLAYATGVSHLLPFFKYDLRQEAFHQIIKDKSTANVPREDLANALLSQYAHIPNNEEILGIIEQLRKPNTYTVTTAHQPSLFMGPLYFIYKAITTLNLAEAIQGIVGPAATIVPVFVLGGEDHDIEEVNHINLFNKTVTWTPPSGKGPVGKIPTDSLAQALEEIDTILGPAPGARAMYARIHAAYTKHKTFGEATRAFLHDLLGVHGLVILDMNEPSFKRSFIPVMEEELTAQTSFKLVSETVEQLNAIGFKTQATPREINLFFMTDTSRERIVKEGDIYKVLNSDLQFTQAEMLAHLHAHPENFSPNVVLRPLFQETVLPNLAYVGGGGELAYWLERKSLFEHFNINYPMLVRRNSVLWIDRDSSRKLDKFGFSTQQFFEDTESLVRQFIENSAATDVNLASEIAELERIVKKIAQKATTIDPTLEAAVAADGVKWKAAFEQWESRIMRAEKQKHEVVLTQLRALKEKFFPNNGLQERHSNFIPFYLRYGERFLDILKEKMLPLEHGFIVIDDN
jgi:bacillithiol synthase